MPKKISLTKSKKLLFCHGSPLSENHYLYKNKIKFYKKILSKIKYDYIFVGNTHFQMRKLNNNIIINPGSVVNQEEEAQKVLNGVYLIR